MRRPRSGRGRRLDLRAVLLGYRVQAIGPVDDTLRIGPAIELTRSRRDAAGARPRARGPGRRRRGIRDPDPRVRRRDAVATQLVAPARELDHVRRRWRRRRRRCDRDRRGRRWRVAHRRAVRHRRAVYRRIVVRRRIVVGWVIVGRRVHDGRAPRHDSEREEWAEEPVVMESLTEPGTDIDRGTGTRKRTEHARTPAHPPVYESRWDSTIRSRERASTTTNRDRASGSLGPGGVGHGDQTRGEDQRGAQRNRSRLHRHSSSPPWTSRVCSRLPGVVKAVICRKTWATGSKWNGGP